MATYADICFVGLFSTQRQASAVEAEDIIIILIWLLLHFF